jgi:ABC-type Fe3+ transport system substrate-binding protein
VRIVTASAVLVALAGAAQAQQARSPELQALVAAAKAEGKLDVTWNQSTMDGARGVTLMQKAMNDMFGTNITIRFNPGGSMPATGNQITMEQNAGKPSSTDLHISSARDMADLVYVRKAFQAAPWQKYLPGRITDDVVEADGMAVKLVSSVPSVTYNTELVPYPPKSLQDFLKPEWKGKIASTPYAANFDLLAATMGPDAALAYSEKLSAQLGGLGNCNQAEKLAAGEFAALVFECNAHNVDKAAAAGAPVAAAFLSDFTAVSYFYIGVPKGAVNPNAAKLFITFLMTPEGQKLVWDTWNADLHFFPESRSRKEIEAWQASGSKLTSVDLKWQQDHPEANATYIKIMKIIAARQ